MKKLLLMFVLTAACSPVLDAASPKGEIVFPPPPDAPRIRYVESISGERDISGKTQRGFLGKLWRFLTGKGEEDMVLLRPYGVWGQGESIFVADTESASVVIFDRGKGKVGRLGAGAQERLVTPIGVAVDASSRAYVTDSTQNVVKAFRHDGSLLWQAGRLGEEAGELKKPSGIALTPKGEVVVADTGNSRIVVFSSEGRFLRQIGKKGEGDGELSVPTNVWAERDGTLLVSDTILCRIQAFSPEGKFLFRFGEEGDTAGYLGRPRGVASDSDGNIYVVDALFNAVQMFNRKGELLMFFGGLGGGPASFELPAGIFIDSSDRVYIADSFNRRVQIFQYLKKN